MSPGPLVIGWHDDIGDLSPVITTGPSTGLREKQTLTWVTNKLHHHQGSFTLTRRHRVTSERSERDLRSVLGLILGKFGSSPLLVTPLVWSPWSVPRVWSHSSLAPELRISGVYWLCVSPNVYSMLIAFVFKLHWRIAYKHNLHQIYIK